MKAKRNTLVNFISQTTGNNEKTYVELKYWYSIYFPDSPRWNESMDYIFDHCVKDVRMTLSGLKVAEKLKDPHVFKGTVSEEVVALAVQKI